MNTINGKRIDDTCTDLYADLPENVLMNPEMYQDILMYVDNNDECMPFSDADIKVRFSWSMKLFETFFFGPVKTRHKGDKVFASSP